MSPRSTPTKSPPRSSLPSYMQPTIASKARTLHPTSPKWSNSASTSMHETKGSNVSTQAATTNIAIIDEAQPRQGYWKRRGLGDLFDVDTNNEIDSPIVEQGSTTTTEIGVVAPAAPIGSILYTDNENETHAGTVQASTPISKSVISELTASKLHLDGSNIKGRAATTPNCANTTTGSTKRKRSDEIEKLTETSLAPDRVAEVVDKSSTDEEPATKKRKTRSSAPKELAELDSGDDDNMVVTQHARKSAKTINLKGRRNKAGVEKARLVAKSRVSDLDNLIKQEDKRQRSAARANIFDRNPMMKRSFNDTISASHMSRPNRILKPRTPEVVPARKPVISAQPPAAEDSSSAEHAPGAVTYEEGDPNVIHADLRSIKYIHVTAIVRNVHIDRIVQSPWVYPNVEIDFDENHRPVKAHITKMTNDEYKLACKAALGREKKKRKLDAKLARQSKSSPKKSSLRKVAGGKVTRQPRKL